MWMKMKKKSTYLNEFFFNQQLTFERENVIFLSPFLNFNLFYLIVVNFL